MMVQRLFSIIFTGIVFLYGCNSQLAPDPLIYHDISDNSFEISNNSVNLANLQTILNREQTLTRSKANLNYEINPIIGSEMDTLMYIVNYSNGHGWKVFSADIRTPAIIAENYNGTFSVNTDNEGFLAWFDCMKKDLAFIRHSTDDMLAFSEEQIAVNKSFWSDKYPSLRSIPLEDPEGVWQIRTTAETFVSDTLEHMVPHWYQREPYNNYCPLKTNGTGDRAKAGCVAVAGAEVLYYLHSVFGLPEAMISYGECIGDINSYYRYFDIETTAVWNDMDPSFHNTVLSGGAETLLIGHIGNLVNMQYHNNFSWALPANLRTNVFNLYGYSCSHGSYDENVVKTNLSAGLPIIVTASDLLIPLDGDIHTFVIDGYKKTYIKYSHYHYWMPFDPDSFIFTPEYESYYTYTYTTPEITSIKINWGWHSQWEDPDNPVNDGWYSLTGSWYVMRNQLYDYNYYRQMIYGFSVSE